MKNREEFHCNKYHKDGLSSYCKPCQNIKTISYRRQNPEKTKKFSRIYYKINSKNRREYARLYAQKNPLRRRINEAKRRARANSTLICFTSLDVINLMDKQSGRCAACAVQTGKKYHVDHIVPLSLGGDNSRFNIQILCPNCNLRKGSLLQNEFMQRMGFTTLRTTITTPGVKKDYGRL